MSEFEAVEKGSADGYLDLCKQVVLLAGTAQELRDWWRENRPQREFYGLTDDHEKQLTAACREQILLLEKAKPAPKPRWQPRRARI